MKEKQSAFRCFSKCLAFQTCWRRTKRTAASNPIAMLTKANVEGSGAGSGENDGEAEKTLSPTTGESSEPEKSIGMESESPIVVGVRIIWSAAICSSACVVETNVMLPKNAAAIIANLNLFLMA